MREPEAFRSARGGGSAPRRGTTRCVGRRVRARFGGEWNDDDDAYETLVRRTKSGDDAERIAGARVRSVRHASCVGGSGAGVGVILMVLYGASEVDACVASMACEVGVWSLCDRNDSAIPNTSIPNTISFLECVVHHVTRRALSSRVALRRGLSCTASVAVRRGESCTPPPASTRVVTSRVPCDLMGVETGVIETCIL